MATDMLRLAALSRRHDQRVTKTAPAMLADNRIGLALEAESTHQQSMSCLA
jgi:hypothetical protein